MEIKNRIYKNCLYISLKGELDEHNASYTREILDNLLEENNFSQVIIELSELEFMDSTGVGVFIGRYKKMKSFNTPIYISNPSKHIDKIFQLTGLYKLMPKLI